MKKQFEIKKIATDEWEIKSLVNTNSIKFKKNVKLAREIQDITPNARLKMFEFMKAKGKTKDDFIEKKVKNGKIIYDETFYRELESGFIRDESINFTYNLFETIFNKNPEELAEYLGITNNSEADRMGFELGKALGLNQKKI